MVLHTNRKALAMISLLKPTDQITAYGRHALSAGEYAPTAGDPFTAGEVAPVKSLNWQARYLFGAQANGYALVCHMSARAGTRRVLGLTGAHRAADAAMPLEEWFEVISRPCCVAHVAP